MDFIAMFPFSNFSLAKACRFLFLFSTAITSKMVLSIGMQMN